MQTFLLSMGFLIFLIFQKLKLLLADKKRSGFFLVNDHHLPIIQIKIKENAL